VIAKAGFVFNVSVCLSLCVNKPKSGSGEEYRNVDRRISGCEYFWQSLFVRLSQQNRVSTLQMRHRGWCNPFPDGLLLVVVLFCLHTVMSPITKIVAQPTPPVTLCTGPYTMRVFNITKITVKSEHNNSRPNINYTHYKLFVNSLH